jgi:murein DD-endopeptidase MepM/ murein hydrolase activator NlpD
MKVKAGDVLGTMGTSGTSTGIHLHWEIWNGKTHGWSADGKGFVEPIEFMKAVIALEGAAAYANMGSGPLNRASSPKTPGAAAKPVEAPVKPVTKASQKPSKAPIRAHKVVSGDTLGKIASKYGTTVQKLISLNKLKNANQINVGQIIRLP